MKRSTLTLAALALGVTLTGCAAAAEPEVVTETVTVTEEVTVESVPASCLDALDHGDDVMDLAGQGFDILAGALDAVAEFDITGIEQATADLQGITPDMAAASTAYQAARDECRAA